MKRLLDRPLAADDLRAHAESVGRPMAGQRKEMRSLMIVRLGAETLAFAAGDVARVQREAPVHRIPHRSNDVIRGLCNIDGDLVLTAALDRLLQISRDPASTGDEADLDRRRMVVIGEPGERWAFAVDAVLAVDRFETDTFRALPVTVERALVHYAESLVPLEDGPAAILDSKRVVGGLQGALT